MLDTQQEQINHLKGLYLAGRNKTAFIVPDVETSVPILQSLADYSVPYQLLTLDEYKVVLADKGLQIYFVSGRDLERILRLIKTWLPTTKVINPATGRID